MRQLHDILASLVVGGGWIGLAIPVRIAGGKLLRAVRHRPQRIRWSGRTVRWSGRHGLPDSLVSAVRSGTIEVAALEAITPRPSIEDVGMDADKTVLSVDDQRLTDVMHAILEEQRADNADAEARAALGAAMREPTTEIPAADLDPHTRYAAADTREWFAAGDGAFERDDAEFSWILHQLLADPDGTLSGDDIGQAAALLQRAQAWRDKPPTGEQPIVIPRQREAVAS